MRWRNAILLSLILGGVYWATNTNQIIPGEDNQQGGIVDQILEPVNVALRHPLAIETLRQTEYPGSDINIEETLAEGTGYLRYRASYLSERNKIYALMTIPTGTKPDGGWPVVILNHGYIPPQEYRTTDKYVAYQDGFARRGYITFKSDYRGHGESEGEPTGAYGSSGYTTDVLNAVASLKKHSDANSEKIGMWGHSMGGYITLRAMVAEQNIKAGVIWAGVVGSYPDMLNNWSRRNFSPPPGIPSSARRWRQVLQEMYGSPESNPGFWNSISANSYLGDLSGPVQIHHGTADASVPEEFSQKLAEQIKAAGKEPELYLYNGDDHNLSHSFGTAIARSVEFFDKRLK